MASDLTGQGITQLDPEDPNTAIQSAANQYGVDPAYLARVAAIESSNNPNAVSSTGAKGLFQFTGGTAKAYGLTNPSDVSQSANAAARLTADNQAALTKALGRQPTSGELYLAHQQGATGAIALITHPNQSAVEALTPVYGGNTARATQALTVNGGTPDMTAGAFTNQWASKFSPQGNNAPTSTASAAPSAPLSLLPTTSTPASSPTGSSQGATNLAAKNFNLATGLGSKIGSAFTTGISAPSLIQLSDTPASVAGLSQV
jgi:hypothetical protein